MEFPLIKNVPSLVLNKGIDESNGGCVNTFTLVLLANNSNSSGDANNSVKPVSRVVKLIVSYAMSSTFLTVNSEKSFLVNTTMNLSYLPFDSPIITTTFLSDLQATIL